MSVLRIPDAHMRALCVCLCVCVRVLEMRHQVGRSYNMDQDPYSQKHFIGGNTDPGSLIRLLWSIKFQSLLKGKTYRGSAPILCCCSSSTKHIQINKISQSRQWDCSLKFWNCRLGTSSGVEQRQMHFSTGLFTYTSPQAQAGVGRIQSHRAVFACACACVCVCVYVAVTWIIIRTSLVIMFSVLSIIRNPLLTELELLRLCVHV